MIDYKEMNKVIENLNKYVEKLKKVDERQKDLEQTKIELNNIRQAILDTKATIEISLQSFKGLEKDNQKLKDQLNTVLQSYEEINQYISTIDKNINNHSKTISNKLDETQASNQNQYNEIIRIISSSEKNIINSIQDANHNLQNKTNEIQSDIKKNSKYIKLMINDVMEEQMASKRELKKAILMLLTAIIGSTLCNIICFVVIFML